MDRTQAVRPKDALIKAFNEFEREVMHGLNELNSAQDFY